MSEQQRDWIGDITLWSFVGTIIAVILKVGFGVSGILIAIPLAIFGLVCVVAFASLVLSFCRDLFS